MADKKKKTAGAATQNGQKENNSTQIIAEPIEIVKRYQSYLTEVFENGKRTERKLQQSA